MGEPRYRIVGTKVDGKRFYETCTQGEAQDWLDAMLQHTAEFSLLGALNDIQACCRDKNGEPLFRLKSEIPLYLVNLVLQRFNLKIEEYEWKGLQ